MPAPLKHHYLPVFYLSRWAGEDGQVCQFSRPYKEIIPERRHPEATGFAKRLYETPGLSADEAQRVEEEFMKRLDTWGSEALTMLENGDPKLGIESKPRSAWSRFIMSLLLRMPEDIAALKNGVAAEWARQTQGLQAKYDSLKGPNDPNTVEEYLKLAGPTMEARLAMTLAPKLMDHVKIGDLINNMRWFVVRITSAAGEFLTSDRPVIMSTTLKEPNAYIMLPIGPKALFVAVNDLETQRRIELRDPAERVEVINRYVARHAVKYVYARDDTALDYVRAHFAKEPRTSLLQMVIDYRASQS